MNECGYITRIDIVRIISDHFTMSRNEKACDMFLNPTCCEHNSLHITF